MLVLKGPAPNLDPGPFSCFQNCANTKYVFHSKFQNPNHPILNMRSNFKTLVPQFIRMKIWTPIHSYIFRIHSYVLRTQSSEGGRVTLSSKRTTAEYPPGKLRRPWTSSVPGGGGGATRLPRRSRTGCSEAQALESRSPEAPRKDGCATHSQPNKANPPVPEPYV